MFKFIRDREQKLQETSDYLKREFVGLDGVIDSIINNIRIWYIMPELIIRPVVVNLWGMTGTGKTDLVRKLVAFLDMEDRFVDIQMDASVQTDDGCRCKSICDALEQSGIDSHNSNIILLDEFQRANTICKSGDTIERELFTDVWMLLSDGRFVKAATGGRNYIDRLKLEIDDYFMKLQFEKDNPNAKKVQNISYDNEIEFTTTDSDDDNNDGSKYQSMFKHSSWYITNIKNRLKLRKSEFELIQMSAYDLNTYIKDHIDKNEQVILQGPDYSKSLIFICGNLDNAYSMAKSVSDADSDADILHKYSKRISIIDIKQCLNTMYKPEQIARLGNNHIIYPCLNKANYTELIYRNLNEYIDKIFENTNIKITYDKKLVHKIYVNYVYPSQGVRPLYSSICSFISNAIPEFLLYSIVENVDSMNITLNKLDELEFKFSNGEVKTKKYSFELDTIKKYIDNDKLMLYAVHESAHALVYTELFNYAPKLINIELTEFDGAYVLPNDMIYTKEVLLNMITVYLAGAVAEKIFFGPMNMTNGCMKDIIEATKYTALMVRKFGMMDSLVHIVPPTDDDANYSNTAHDETNINVREIINTCEQKAKEIILSKSVVLQCIVEQLIKVKKISGVGFVDLVSAYYPNLEKIDPLEDISFYEIAPKYVDMFYDGLKAKE